MKQKKPNTILTIINYSKRHWLGIFVGFFINYFLAFYIGLILNNQIIKNIVDRLNNHDFIMNRDYWLIILYILTINANRFLHALAFKFRFYARPKLREDIKNHLFQYNLKKSMNFFNNNLSGSLAEKISKIPDYITEINEITTKSLALLIVIFILLLKFFSISRFLSIFLICWILIYLVIITISLKKVKKFSKIASKNTNESYGFITDDFTNISNIKIFAREKFEKARLKSINLKILKNKSTVLLWWSINKIIDYLYTSLAVFVATYVAVKLKINSQISLGETVFIISSFSMIVFRISDVMEKFIDVADMYGALEDSLEIVSSPDLLAIENKSKNNKLENVKGKIVFKSIIFSYK